jgi:hypothetical protein
MTAQDSLRSVLDYECFLFFVTDLVFIYESITSSASALRWLTINPTQLNYLPTKSLLNQVKVIL